MARPKKGDVLVYTGEYEAGVPPYGRGEVVRFHTNRWHGPSVTVRLIEEGDDDLYADWPIKWTSPA